MDVGFYKVDAWGESVGEGVSDARYCTLGGVAKLDSANSPYAVANEYICGTLATLLRLPAPPGIMVKTDEGALAYIALRFGLAGEKPPPVIPLHLVEDHPFVASGIVAFDCLIANVDRHGKNLAYSREGIPPTIFDHSHALCGYAKGKAVARFSADRDKQSLGGHCIAACIMEGSLLMKWAERIGGLADHVFDDVCHEAAKAGAITNDEAHDAVVFLKHRRDHLPELLKAGPLMAGIKNWEPV